AAGEEAVVVLPGLPDDGQPALLATADDLAQPLLGRDMGALHAAKFTLAVGMRGFSLPLHDGMGAGFELAPQQFAHCGTSSRYPRLPSVRIRAVGSFLRSRQTWVRTTSGDVPTAVSCVTARVASASSVT